MFNQENKQILDKIINELKSMKSLLDDMISMPVKALAFNSVGNFEADAIESDERFQKLVAVRNSIQNIEEDGFELH